MKKEAEITVIDTINELKAKAWNESMAPRIPSLISYFAGDEWQKGIGPWLMHSHDALMSKLITGCKTRDDDQFVRGQLAMLKDMIDLPAKCKHIDDMRKEVPPQRGTAGY
jgi:hypothetical protein